MFDHDAAGMLVLQVAQDLAQPNTPMLSATKLSPSAISGMSKVKR